MGDRETVASLQSPKHRLRELSQIFLKLGVLGFGGPQAHIAMMNDEFVSRRQWMSNDEFAEGMAICEMLPGPASTQMGIYSGYLRAGQIGALVAGLSFIGPAFLIVLALSWGYFKFQGLPQLDALFFGVSPVVVAIILAFCWKLGKKSVTGWPALAITVAVFLTTLLTSISLILQFLAAGLLGMALYRPRLIAAFTPFILRPSSFVLANTPTEILPLASFWGAERIGQFFAPLALFFLKVGTAIFGGGLVIIPLIEQEVVEKLQWMTTQEFINGVAIGQLSPGPVVLTSAFVGYKVAGVWGALVSAIAIFTPSFAFIMLAAPLLCRLRQSPWVRAFLQGVKPAVVGAIAAASIPLVRTAMVLPTVPQSLIAGLIGLAALFALTRYKTPTWQLVPAGAVMGLCSGALLGI